MVNLGTSTSSDTLKTRSTHKRLPTTTTESILYKKNYDMVLLRCVDSREAEQMLVEVHEGSFGTHANGHAMA